MAWSERRIRTVEHDNGGFQVDRTVGDTEDTVAEKVEPRLWLGDLAQLDFKQQLFRTKFFG